MNGTREYYAKRNVSQRKTNSIWCDLYTEFMKQNNEQRNKRGKQTKKQSLNHRETNWWLPKGICVRDRWNGWWELGKELVGMSTRWCTELFCTPQINLTLLVTLLEFKFIRKGVPLSQKKKKCCKKHRDTKIFKWVFHYLCVNSSGITGLYNNAIFSF